MVTNDDLSKRMDTTDEWIRERVGIAERRFAGRKDTVVDMAVEAGSKAIADAGLAPSDVGHRDRRHLHDDRRRSRTPPRRSPT